jgi:photosystem II reaction center protein PsbP
LIKVTINPLSVSDYLGKGYISSIIVPCTLVRENQVGMFFIFFGLFYGLVNPPFIHAQPQPQPAEALTFKNYTDPAGRFSIEYPSSWTVRPAENRFSLWEVAFEAPINYSLSIDLRILNDLDAPEGIERLMEDSIITLPEEVPNFILEEGVECEKYAINDKKACSIIYTRGAEFDPNFEYAVMQVSSLVDEQLYVLTYEAPTSHFDPYLPTIEKMIDSVQIKS